VGGGSLARGGKSVSHVANSPASGEGRKRRTGLLSRLDGTGTLAEGAMGEKELALITN
jgi:hypothetical protein